MAMNVSSKKASYNSNLVTDNAGELQPSSRIAVTSSSQFVTRYNAPATTSIEINFPGPVIIDVELNPRTTPLVISSMGGTKTIERDPLYQGVLLPVADNGSLEIVDVIIDGKNVSSNGSLISLGVDAALLLDAVTIQNGNNRANGGAINAKAGAIIDVTNDTTFIDNKAINGGAVALAPGALINVDDSSHFVRNIASKQGGAIYVAYGPGLEGISIENGADFSQNRSNQYYVKNPKTSDIAAYYGGVLNTVWSCTSGGVCSTYGYNNYDIAYPKQGGSGSGGGGGGMGGMNGGHMSGGSAPVTSLTYRPPQPAPAPQACSVMVAIIKPIGCINR